MSVRFSGERGKAYSWLSAVEQLHSHQISQRLRYRAILPQIRCLLRSDLKIHPVRLLPCLRLALVPRYHPLLSVHVW